MTDPIPCNCWINNDPMPCVFDDLSTDDICDYATELRDAGKPKTTCRHYRSAAGLTDEQLLDMAKSTHPWATWLANGGCLECAHFELAALMRAAIAAHDAARPQPTAEQIEARFRAWWAESYPNAPAGPHAVRSHVAFALHMLGGEGAA